MDQKVYALKYALEEAAEKILRSLDTDSATGPDYLPTRMLKECSQHFAKPFRMLAIFIFHAGAWPLCWMIHWVMPFFKKGATFMPDNYRGVHLTPQLSKAMERFIGIMMMPFMSLPRCIGEHQFAYQNTTRSTRCITS